MAKVVLLLLFLLHQTSAFQFHQCEQRSYQKKGCYPEDAGGVVIFNDRNNINWKNFPKYIKDVACECEQQAKSKGFHYFAIRFYAICVGINIAHNDVLPNPVRDKCQNTNYKSCSDFDSIECVGPGDFEYIYLIGRDGGYSEWSNYGSCSVTCGEGFQQRRRECDNPVRLGNGKTCDVLGPSTQKKECVKSACKVLVDGEYGEWSAFGPCSKSCGGGIQTKTRKCDSPPPSNGGRNCQGGNQETQSCNIGKCSVDGEFGQWSAFSPCSKSCGGGVQTKTRKCDSPPPSNGGKYCQGGNKETQSCNIGKCSVDGEFGQWSAFGPCSKSCGGGIQTKTRKCDSPPPSNGGRNCQGENQQTQSCNIGKCSVDGEFGQWSAFGPCSKSCGGGIQTKTRKCDSPPPSNGGQYCQGVSFNVQACNNHICAVDGKFGEWAAFGVCSVTCGGGMQYRSRKCDSPAPTHGGKNCIGALRDSSVCSTAKCPPKKIDGGFSQWTSFSSCTKTCGGGVQLRTRDCNNPKPQNGGKNCEGPREDRKGCKNNFCEGVDGVTKAQVVVAEVLKNFFNKTYKKPCTAKFLKVIFEIQKAIAEEFITVDPSQKHLTLKQLLAELQKLLVSATNGGSIDFARVCLGKSLLVLIKEKIKEGVAIDVDMDKAAEEYLKSLKNKIGEEKFNKLISSQGDSTLMFAMDTTNSMKGEIRAAKSIATTIIRETRSFSVDYILSPFNDPRVGPVTKMTEKEREGVIQKISNLRIHGGGDCPELAFRGMLDAVNAGPNFGSPMFVFTDASAKDDTPGNMASLQAAAELNSITINFFVQLQGCKGKGIESFKEIATATGGQVFPLQSDKDLEKFTQYVKTSLQQDTLIAAGGTLNRMTGKYATYYGQKTHKFVVDDGITKLIVSIATAVPGSASYVKLFSPGGRLITPTTTISMARIFEKPKGFDFVGQWTLVFPITVGKYKYSVQAISNKPIEFSHSFVYQQSPRKNSPAFTFPDPIRGSDNLLLVRAGGNNLRPTSLRCDLVDVQGGVLQYGLTFTRSEGGVYATRITPPNSSFKLKCTGQSNAGSRFERLSRGIATSKTVFIRPMYIGTMFSVPISRHAPKVNAMVQVINHGGTDNFDFEFQASHGNVDRRKNNVRLYSMGFVSFTYQPPSQESLRGHTELISITVTRKSNNERSTSTIKLLLV